MLEHATNYKSWTFLSLHHTIETLQTLLSTRMKTAIILLSGCSCWSVQCAHRLFQMSMLPQKVNILISCFTYNFVTFFGHFSMQYLTNGPCYANRDCSGPSRTSVNAADRAAMSTRNAHTLSLIIGSAISVIFLSVKLVTAHEYCMYNCEGHYDILVQDTNTSASVIQTALAIYSQ